MRLKLLAMIMIAVLSACGEDGVYSDVSLTLGGGTELGLSPEAACLESFQNCWNAASAGMCDSSIEEEFVDNFILFSSIYATPEEAIAHCEDECVSLYEQCLDESTQQPDSEQTHIESDGVGSSDDGDA